MQKIQNSKLSRKDNKLKPSIYHHYKPLKQAKLKKSLLMYFVYQFY